MGRKISVDSATMMNKALEVIEARYLFGLAPERIEVVIHPQSIVHSMVQYRDTSVVAQLGTPDMRVPIAFGLGWPDRIASGAQALDFQTLSAMTFEAIDSLEHPKRFPGLWLSWQVLQAAPGTTAVLNAANQAGAGNLPAGVKRMIKDLTDPVIDWRTLLEQQIQSTVKSDFSWMKPSRRGWHMDAVMPGMLPGTQIDVFIGMDTSGSISERDIKDFLSEIKGIMESYDEYKIHVVTWDTEVYNHQIFTSDNLSDIETYEPQGGGGTDPMCVWQFLKDNDIEPKKLIMFTDYCFFGWEPKEVEPYCDTVWVIKGNPDAEPEFGVWAHYEEAKRSK
jgi:hypothetical protein